MSTERETNRIVRSWLDEGVTALPDRVLDAVLDQVPATRQRRPWWPAWRATPVNTFGRLAVATATVIVAAAVGLNLLPRSPGSGAGPTTSAAPPGTTAPTPTASPAAMPNVSAIIQAGRYKTPSTFEDSFELSVEEPWRVGKVTQGQVTLSRVAGDAPWVGFYHVTAIYTDPCHPERGKTDVGRATTLAEVEQPFQAMTGFTTSSIESVSVGNRLAHAFTLSNEIDTTAERCTNGQLLALFDPKGQAAESTNPGTTELVWVVDHGLFSGGRLVIVGEASTPADRAVLDALIDSVRFPIIGGGG